MLLLSLRRARFVLSFAQIAWLFIFALVVMLFVVPAVANATAVAQTPKLVFPTAQVWELVIGSLVPLVTYVLNHVGPWVTEPMKAFVTLAASAIAGGVYAAISTSVVGFNDQTLQLILTSVIASFGAHALLWKPSGISTILGAGTNRQVPLNFGGGSTPAAPAAAPKQPPAV